MKYLTPNSSLKKAVQKIKVLAMDVDGVLTSGLICLDSKGQEVKSFHSQDGLGLVLAKHAGLKTVFISSRKSRALEIRARELRVDRLYQDQVHKLEALEDLMCRFSVSTDEVSYVGDDLIDLVLLKRVGFPVAVANAVEEVKKAAKYITGMKGGEGAIREVVEYILKIQGCWQDVTREYLEDPLS